MKNPKIHQSSGIYIGNPFSIKYWSSWRPCYNNAAPLQSYEMHEQFTNIYKMKISSK